MHIRVTEYMTAKEFAKTYMKEDGSVGCSRLNIVALCRREIAKPGSTKLDVLTIGSEDVWGVYYVKLKTKPEDQALKYANREIIHSVDREGVAVTIPVQAQAV